MKKCITFEYLQIEMIYSRWQKMETILNNSLKNIFSNSTLAE